MRLVAAVISVIAGCSSALAQTYDENLAALPKGLPASVHDFIDRRANCNHWLGEYPYDSDRRTEIEAALTKLHCDALKKDEENLRKQYDKDRAVLKALEISKDWSPG
jgi:hypothetical protein